MMFLVAARFTIAFASNMWFVCLGELFISVGSGLFSTLTAALLSSHAEGNTGFLLGVSESTKSALGIVGPAAGGLLFDWYGPTAPPLAAGVVTAAGLVVFCCCCARLGGALEAAKAEEVQEKRRTKAE